MLLQQVLLTFSIAKKSATNVYKVMKFLLDVEGSPEILQSDNGK